MITATEQQTLDKMAGEIREAEKPKREPWSTITIERPDGTVETKPSDVVGGNGFYQSPEMASNVAEIMRKHGGKLTPEAKAELLALQDGGAASGPARVLERNRAYLLAVCRATSGVFDHLTDAELLDVAALSRLPIRDVDTWQQIKDACRV